MHRAHLQIRRGKEVAENRQSNCALATSPIYEYGEERRSRRIAGAPTKRVPKPGGYSHQAGCPTFGAFLFLRLRWDIYSSLQFFIALYFFTSSFLHCFSAPAKPASRVPGGKPRSPPVESIRRPAARRAASAARPSQRR